MMFKLKQQKGSSTVGLLTATAIFIGLLVYANQFAFNNSDNSLLSSFINKTPDTVATPSDEVISSADTDTIQPSPQGIFETPTLIQQDSKQLVNSMQPGFPTKQNPQAFPEIELATNQALPQPAMMPVNNVPGQWYGDQAALASYNAYHAGVNNNQQYYTNSRANGRGNGRGNMNGDGDFNFSMKFKARGRMDANSDIDSNLSAYGNAYQQNSYDLNAVTSPAYGYNYYSH